jgi:hypothetical protein
LYNRRKYLPIKEEECTYRGIIIKHKNINNYLLYKTKQIIIGKEKGGSKMYHNFVENGPLFVQELKI